MRYLAQIHGVPNGVFVNVDLAFRFGFLVSVLVFGFDIGFRFVRNGANKISFSLPDDILFEILLRLPVKTLIRCRAVCKHWKTLTSTPHFIHNHFLKQQATPSLVIMYGKKYWHSCEYKEEILYMKDRGSTTFASSLLAKLFKQKNMNLSGFRIDSVFHVPFGVCPQLAHYCDNGLFLYVKLGWHVKSYVLWNPVTQEKAELNNINEYGDICACFYHPIAKEYRLICVGGMKKSNNWEFTILNLWGKVFSQTFFAHGAKWMRTPPVVLYDQQGGLLHWMIEDENRQEEACCEESIIVFNIRTETFSAMPHPGDKCKGSRHEYMRLLHIKTESEISLLCLCDCTVPSEIEMWVLEDYQKRVWVRRHKIFVGIKVINDYNYISGRTIPFGILNGDLLFHCYKKGLLAYNILEKTVSNISDDDYSGFDFLTHAAMQSISLVSFKKSN